MKPFVHTYEVPVTKPNSLFTKTIPQSDDYSTKSEALAAWNIKGGTVHELNLIALKEQPQPTSNVRKCEQ